MILILRKLREKLMQKNKTTTYLFYALGEIVLVVIGILIALSINNYSQDLKDRSKEQKILSQLKEEYQLNLKQLDEKIAMRDAGIEAAKYILSVIDKPASLNEEQFYTSLWVLHSDPTFDPIKNDLIVSGNLRLITNDTLSSLLSNWTTEVYQVQELEIFYTKYRTETLMPMTNRLGWSRNIVSSVWQNGYSPTEALDKNTVEQLDINLSLRKANYSKNLKDIELEGIIAHTAVIHANANLQSEALRNRIIEIIAMIEREIESP